jgi:putative transposase
MVSRLRSSIEIVAEMRAFRGNPRPHHPFSGALAPSISAQSWRDGQSQSYGWTPRQKCAKSSKAIRHHAVLEKITIDESEVNAVAIRRYNREHNTAIILCQMKYVHNIMGQDHRGVKRITRSVLGFKSFEAAQGTLLGIEFMPMPKQGQMVVEKGAEGLTPAERFSFLAI